eukprot:350904-Chlamydomonas_euryale.AAC.5
MGQGSECSGVPPLTGQSLPSAADRRCLCSHGAPASLLAGAVHRMHTGCQCLAERGHTPHG